MQSTHTQFRRRKDGEGRNERKNTQPDAFFWCSAMGGDDALRYDGPVLRNDAIARDLMTAGDARLPQVGGENGTKWGRPRQRSRSPLTHAPERALVPPPFPLVSAANMNNPLYPLHT